MKRSQSILLSTTLITALVAFSLGWLFAKNIGTSGADGKNTFLNLTGTSSAEGSRIQVRNLDEVWKKLQDIYYDPTKLDITKLTQSAVKGFVAGISDPYTVFMTPEESKEFNDTIEGQLEGIGAQLEVKDGKLVVVTPLKNSPAEKAGIKSGDIIVKIDGKEAGEMTLYDAIRNIRGKKDTEVTLTVLHERAVAPVEMKIVRSEIIIESVVVKKPADNIVLIELNQFNDHTKSEFENAIQKILLEKPIGVIIDVRGNGGGFLDISVDLLSELLSGKKTAVIIKKKDQSKNETVQTDGSSRLEDIPLVVLVNKGSASASEILAGALQDYHRAVIIGEKTFGKGSVQEIDKLNDGSTLRLTIAKWFTPLDRSIDGIGVSPDIEVKMTDEDVKNNNDPQLNEALRYLKKNK